MLGEETNVVDDDARWLAAIRTRKSMRLSAQRILGNLNLHLVLLAAAHESRIFDGDGTALIQIKRLLPARANFKG